MSTTTESNDGQSSLWKPMDEARDDIRKAASPPLKILILGAGMSGLGSAYELAHHPAGHTVHVFEGSRRVGGRVMTHYFDKEKQVYHELGAMRIPLDTHDYTMRYVDDMKLEVRKFSNAHENGFYDIQDQRFRMDADGRRKLVALFPGLAEWERDIVTEKGAGGLLAHYMDPVDQPLRLNHALARLLVQGKLAEDSTGFLRMLDSKSVLGYLLEQVRAARATEAGVALVGAALSEECRWHWSLAAELRASRTNNAGKRGLVEICGGFEKLPEAMYQALTRMGARVNFTFEREVTAIHLVNGKARVEVRHAGTKQRLPHLTGYDRVLCTLPFPVMRRIEVTGVSPAKLRAIRNMEYASSTKVLLHCSDRFWEKGERPIRGGSSISDRLSRQTYYPSDSVPATSNQDLVSAAAAPEPEGFWSTQTQFDELPAAPAPALADANGAPRPGVLLGSYSWCDNARQLGKLTHHHEGAVTFDASSGGEFRALVNHVLGDIKHIHPEVTDHFVNGAAIFWDEYRWSRGAFAITPPGDLSHYYQDGLRREGNLSFAGEHLSIAPGWIQGALESGLRATLEMLLPSQGDG